MIEAITAAAVTTVARVVTGVQGNWFGCAPEAGRRVYFANHVSHGDFVLILTLLPAPLRRVTRPVAAADYWQKSAVRRFLGERVFNSVLIQRDPATRTEDPVDQMSRALDQGSSLILFPEGTRNTTDAKLLPFKSGLYHLANAQPEAELVPTWIENLNRVMPKGEIVPIPLLCTVTFGTPLRLQCGEAKKVFLERARSALLALAPKNGDQP